MAPNVHSLYVYVAHLVTYCLFSHINTLYGRFVASKSTFSNISVASDLLYRLYGSAFYSLESLWAADKSSLKHPMIELIDTEYCDFTNNIDKTCCRKIRDTCAREGNMVAIMDE